MISWEQLPRRNPINSSLAVCAFKYRLEVATRPVQSVNKLMAMVMLISKWMLRATKKVKMLPIPKRCMLVLNLKNNSISVADVAVNSPVK